MKRTPLELEILLHYYCKGDDFRQGDFSAPAVKEAMERFLRDGWLESAKDRPFASYSASSKTMALIEAVCDVPDPVQKWIIPEAR